MVVIYYTSKLLSCLTNYFKLAKALHICIIVPNFIYCIPVILVTTVILFVTVIPVIPVILAIQFIPVILLIPVI